MNWECHATIAKKSAAMKNYKSRKQFLKESHLFSFSQDLIAAINSRLYKGSSHYAYGDYSFSEVELNAMRSNGDYYVTEATVPIAHAIAFDSIRDPPEVNANRQVSDLYGDLPKRKCENYVCNDCNLHFHSERQLNRHLRSHRTIETMSEEEPLKPQIKPEYDRHSNLFEQCEERELITADGPLLLMKEDVSLIVSDNPSMMP